MIKGLVTWRNGYEQKSFAPEELADQLRLVGSQDG
jgi:hypothetical protein